jgi:hypothetical protein
MQHLRGKVQGTDKVLDYDLLDIYSTKDGNPWPRYPHKKAGTAGPSSNGFILHEYVSLRF